MQGPTDRAAVEPSRPSAASPRPLPRQRPADRVRDLHSVSEELRLAFDEAPTGMALVEIDDDGVPQVVRANRALHTIFAVDDDEDAPPFEVVARLGGTLLHDCTDAVERLASGRETRVSRESSGLRPDGSVLHVQMHASVAPAHAGRRTQIIVHVTDVTEHRQAQLEMHRLAMSDPTTGLDNRAEFERRLGTALARVVPGRRAVAMLLLDLDRFKVVNDSLGHVAGDALLVEVAGRIAETAPEGACVARLGGDEFAVVVDPAPSPGALIQLAHLLRERLARPYVLPRGDVVVCTASIGLTRVDDPASTLEDVHREADLALYEAKDLGRNACRLSDERMRAKADARIEAETRLRAALAAGGVRIHLQPVVGLPGGTPEGAEALARLEHPVHGLLAPAEFVEVAEDTGLIADVDLEVARLAVEHLATHPDAPPWVAVNAAPRTLLQPAYAVAVRSALEAHGVDPARLHVEITERSLLDGAQAGAEALEALRGTGVRVGIDDFGTGYSALAYLDRFPLDFLKIDRTFVARLAQDPTGRSESLVAAIVALAHVYGMTVTGEGVETPEQAQALARVGCDRAQGWLFGRPAPPA